MGRTLKTFTVGWTPQGDPKRILGWNVVLNGSATDPYASPVYGQVFVPSPRGTDYSWVGSPRNVELKHVAVDGGGTVYAWVQQVYRGGDSEWISSTGASAADDGIATADEIAETTTRKWAGESGADKTQSALDTGVTTTGTLQVKGGDNVVKGGITGAGSDDTAVCVWAGADFANRDTAPFRVTRGGDGRFQGEMVVGGAANGFLVGIGRRLISTSVPDPSETDWTADSVIAAYLWTGSQWTLIFRMSADPGRFGKTLEIYPGDEDGIDVLVNNTVTPRTAVKGEVFGGPGDGVYGVGGTTGGNGVAGKGVYGLKGEARSSTSGAPLYLVPYSTAGPPSHAAYKGSLAVDTNGVLYINTDGTSTGWQKVGAQ